jgi:hypothetical protein
VKDSNGACGRSDFAIPIQQLNLAGAKIMVALNENRDLASGIL